MNLATIEDLAYLFNQAKQENLPKPIVFLGAGASKTGGVPLASEIIADILEKYKDKPNIRSLKKEERTYPTLMGCLTPFERNKLLKKYINNAKINVTHIYLAQLIIKGYVDYVLTVNFDNLMLRALALFNEFPPTYDMAILKDLTTTSFKEKSVVYLHGQHHGLWLLNTTEEMAKVKEMIPPILSSIKNERAWIFIGYSGEDPIFEHITKLGRFDNGLYWISFNENTPSNLVCEQLLNKALTNAFLIKGFDSDSFMLKLNSELNLQQPTIIDKPFTSLKNTLENIVDIDDKEHFKGVKERLEIVKKDVELAIQQFEEGKPVTSQKEEVDINLFKKKIIDKIIEGNFKEDEIKPLENTADGLKNEDINASMSALYNSWGIEILELARSDEEEFLFEQSIEKYKKATQLNPKDADVFNNWGNALSYLAKLKNDETLFEKSFEKYKKAIELNPKNSEAFYNWGTAISDLAKLKNDASLFEQSFEKYRRATELNLKNTNAFNNWGNAISNLAKLKNSETLFEQSFEKYKKATELNPKEANTFYNWGNAISDLAKLKNDETLFEQSFEKYKKATELNLKNAKAFNNWGNAISNLARLKKDETVFEQSFKKYKKTIELNPEHPNASYNWGTALSDLAKLKNDEKLFEQSFEKYKKATELNPKNIDAFNNWGNTVGYLAKLKNDEALFEQGFEILKTSIRLGGNSYNLACFYALWNDKANALITLETSLKNKDITTSFVKTDDDWKSFLNDDDFIKLLKKYN